MAGDADHAPIGRVVGHPIAGDPPSSDTPVKGGRPTQPVARTLRELLVASIEAEGDGPPEAVRVLCWFSCGAASAVATKLTLRENPDALVVYCDTGAEHPDNERFMADCERWFNRPVERIKSAVFADTWAVWEKRRYLSGFNGAPCTEETKVAPRLDYQLPSDTHVFGYTADKLDAKRATRMKAEYPLMKQRHPLIENDLTKQNVLAIVESAGIELPVMYRLGFQNNNCIPCVKASSPTYWAAIRKHFPAQFGRMTALSRELGARLVILRQEVIDGKRTNVRGFIDEIPADWPTLNPIAPACDFLCQSIDMEGERLTHATPSKHHPAHLPDSGPLRPDPDRRRRLPARRRNGVRPALA